VRMRFTDRKFITADPGGRTVAVSSHDKRLSVSDPPSKESCCLPVLIRR
jgi:hypothetical protein